MTKELHNELLGMNVSTATAQLRKALFYKMADQLDLLDCHRCGERIESALELSVDHVKPWRYESADLFWDLENIAYSHRRCNKADRSRRIQSPEGTSWCASCKDHLPVEEFGSGDRWNGLNFWCLACNRKKAAEYDKRNRRFPCPECANPMRKTCRKCGYVLPMKDYMKMRRDEGASY